MQTAYMHAGKSFSTPKLRDWGGGSSSRCSVAVAVPIVSMRMLTVILAQVHELHR
jgi:hypothetical protein